jgi:hypothetical protein
MRRVMTKRPHEPAFEALTNVGLFLNVAAILAFAIGLAGLGSQASLLAAGTVAFSALLFLASLICFAIGGAVWMPAAPGASRTWSSPLTGSTKPSRTGAAQERRDRADSGRTAGSTEPGRWADIFICESAAADGRRPDPEGSASGVIPRARGPTATGGFRRMSTGGTSPSRAACCSR